MNWNLNIVLSSSLFLLIFSGLGIAPKNDFQKGHFLSFNQSVQAKNQAKFVVNQQIVVKIDAEYYQAIVTRVYELDGFTMIDFSWTLADGGSGEGSYPADDEDLFSMAEAKDKKFTIANANVNVTSNPVATTTNSNPAPVTNTTNPITPQTIPAAPVTAVVNTGSGSTTCSGSNQLTDAEIQQVLQVHNTARAAVNVPPLTWNCKLADFAQAWVNRDVWEHSSDQARRQIIVGSYSGENLAGAAPSTSNIATEGPTGWWEEKTFWNNDTGTCQTGEVCGHYTQMVWRKTTEVGCGLNRQSSVMGEGWEKNSAYLSCVYNPGGNMSGQKPF